MWLLLRRWKSIVIGICFALVLGYVVTLVSPVEYQSSVELLPSSSDASLTTMAGLGSAIGFASAFGIDLGAPSVAMAYPDMLKSRQIRERILDRTFGLESGRRGTLAELLNFVDAREEVARARALHYLDRKVRIALDKETGVLEIRARMPHPDLARLVAAAYVDELVRIENELRRRTSSANKEFIRRRLEEMEPDLRRAEEAIEDFQAQNVRVGSDPRLQLEAARLARELRIQEEIHLTLTRQLELAKIAVHREERGVQVIDPPQRPLRSSSPILIKNLVLGGFLGLVGTSLIMLGLDVWTTARRRIKAATWEVDPIVG